jgi:hypothetical protein
LKREVDANQSLYDGLLQSYKEARRRRRQGRIIAISLNLLHLLTSGFGPFATSAAQDCCCAKMTTEARFAGHKSLL